MRILLAATLAIPFASWLQGSKPAAGADATGLVAAFESADRTTRVERVEARVAGTWPEGESPHPSIAPDGFRARWTGDLVVPRAGTYRLAAAVSGRLRLTLDGKVAIDGESAGGTGARETVLESAPLALEPGAHALEVAFERTPGPARVQLLWESGDFGRVPLPASALRHAARAESTALLADASAERGRRLFERLRCGACHARADAPPAAPAPDLSEIGGRTTEAWIHRFLESPASFRPGTEMPEVMPREPESDSDRADLARYLALLRPKKTEKREPHAGDAKRGRELFVSRGCVACHDAPGSSGEKAAGSRATVALGAAGSKYSAGSLATFLEAPLRAHPAGTMPDLRVGREEAAHLAAFLANARDAAFEVALPPRPDDVKDADVVGRGRELVFKRGCLACHAIGDQPRPAREATPLDGARDLAARPGCVAPDGSFTTAGPRYRLAPEERADLAAYLARPSSPPRAKSAAHDARAAIERFRCLQCHARDGAGGGVADRQRAAVAPGEEGSLEQAGPPELSDVGARLRPEWMRDLFAKNARARPWLALRMPHFGAPEVERLAEGLAALDGADLTSPKPAPSDDARAALVGRDLIGKSGFACTACHDLAGWEASVAFVDSRGPDLALAAARVRPAWFRRWMLDPQALAPGTKMPTYFPEGRSTLAGRHGLDAGGQIDALFDYLALGAKAPLPEGLRGSSGWSWVPEGAPAIQRTPFDGAPRSIAVGFPAGVSLAYDASRGMLRQVWSGGFLRMDGTQWTGNHGPYPTPEGATVWRAKDGEFPWAFPPASDVKAVPVPRSEGVRFLGYTESAGNYTFRVAVPAGDAREVEVRERFVGAIVDGAPRLDRHVECIGLPAGREMWHRLGPFERDASLSIHLDAPPLDDGKVDGGLIVATSSPKIVHVRVQSSVPGVTIAPRDEKSGAKAAWIRVPADSKARNVSIRVLESFGGDNLGTVPIPEHWEAATQSGSFSSAPLVEASFDGVPVKGENPFALEEASYPLESLPVAPGIVLQAGGMDFLADGTLAICTRRGEVWLLENATKTPADFKWRRFAHGLHEPLGLRVVDGTIYVLQKPELTRLRDTDGDGVADAYEAISAAWGLSTNFHEFAFGLEHDRSGAFWGTLGLAIKPGGATREEQVFARGSVWRVDASGRFEVIALGARTPNGTGFGPDGAFYYTDNQGDYIPACKLQEVRRGEFYGQRFALSDRDANVEVTPPTVWLPYGAVSQSATQVVVEDREGRFGPFAGQLLVGELTNSQILRVQLETVNGKKQGTCWIFRRGFASGLNRMVFGPDDRLYVGQTTGGWGARGGKLFALERIAFSGNPPFEMKRVHLLRDGFEIEMTKPLAADVAVAPSIASVEQFHYHYWATYGSPEIDRKAVAVTAASLSPDRRTLRLAVPGLLKDRICEIRLRGVKSETGEPLVHSEAYYTLNELPD